MGEQTAKPSAGATAGEPTVALAKVGEGRLSQTKGESQLGSRAMRFNLPQTCRSNLSSHLSGRSARRLLPAFVGPSPPITRRSDADGVPIQVNSGSHRAKDRGH